MVLSKTRFVVIVGSIMSGLGKGILSSSIAKLLKARGFNVVPVKFDGYLNVDCGTMNPFRHGEVFVLDDGTEVDMDFGTYERFLNQSVDKGSSITGGKLFQRIIEKERKGEYLGRDVQFVPHLTDEIKRWINSLAEEKKADIVLVEVGGTVGDLENSYFLEAIRQMYYDQDHMAIVQLSYVPSLSPGELKTKPTQHATRLLQSMGIQPHIIICREQEKLSEEAKEKIAVYSNVLAERVFDDPSVSTVYALPLELERQKFYDQLAGILKLEKTPDVDLSDWKRLVSKIEKPKNAPLKVAIVGKYIAVKDAYVSVKEALVHSAASLDHGLEIEWIESEELESGNLRERLAGIDGIIVPGGFGKRGIEGKINAIEYCRTNKVPYLGLCLGMQLMCIEYARNVCGLKGANSTEFDKDTPHPLIYILPEQKKITKLGGTLRLGAYEAAVEKGTATEKAYKETKVSERHRHRYEVNPDYVEKLQAAGLVVAARHDSGVVEICEWKDSFGIATQAHIELKSRLEEPAPLFVAFLKAAGERKK